MKKETIERYYAWSARDEDDQQRRPKGMNRPPRIPCVRPSSVIPHRGAGAAAHTISFEEGDVPQSDGADRH
jgi:hypothetical protein